MPWLVERTKKELPTLLHHLVGPINQLGCKVGMDVYRPTLINLVAGAEGSPSYCDECGGMGFAYGQNSFMAETKVLRHGYREGDQVWLVFADGMHQGVRRNSRAKEDALPTMVLEEVADHPASHLMQGWLKIVG